MIDPPKSTASPALDAMPTEALEAEYTIILGELMHMEVAPMEAMPPGVPDPRPLLQSRALDIQIELSQRRRFRGSEPPKQPSPMW